ncbi:MAG: hypothetical protein EOO75_03780 [Myxococcales bacterium]|nr:MAG: hypothetical protein EOO75_03780 [Myxococcales bacterium]
MRSHLPALVATLALSACAPTASTAPRAPSIVPLRSVRLYETGVGYFERAGDVGGAPSLPVPTSHLDDALKSLVILGPGAQVQGLSFASNLSRPMARALVGMPEGAESFSYRDLLTSLKGALVELTVRPGSSRLTGRLVDVAEETPAGKPAPPRGAEKSDAAGAAGTAGTPHVEAEPPPALRLVLMMDDGSLRRLRADEIEGLRPLDPSFAQRLGTALDVMAPRAAQVQRTLKLMGQSGPVTFGYIAEAPLWRSSYRLVLEGGTAMFQGWALLHNDTDEDWRDVQLTLVNGRPDSFLFPLAAPRYQRRELVHPDQPLPTVPQLLGRGADELWGEGTDETTTIYGHGSGSGSGVGYGRGSGSLSGSHSSKVGSSGLLTIGNLATVAQATGSEQGALFSYKVSQTLSIDGHSSALVPFLAQQVTPRSLTWIEDDGARAGVRFENTTGQTLPAGTLAVFRDGGFAGEATLDRLKPGERRFVTFGADLDVELDSHRRNQRDEIKRVTASVALAPNGKDTLEEHFLRTTEHSIVLENRGPQPRSVYLVLPLDRNAQVTGADALDFDTAQSKPVAIFELAPRQKLERTFTSVEGLSRRTETGRLEVEALRKLAEAPALPAADRTGVRDVQARRAEQLEAERVVTTSKAELAETEREIERLRKNLEALGGDKSVRPDANPFVRRLLVAEDRLAELRRRIDTQDKQIAARRDAVREALRKLEPVR